MGVTGPRGDIDPHSGRRAKDILPYTKASLKQGPDIGYKGHLGDLKLKEDELTVINPEDAEDNDIKNSRRDNKHQLSKTDYDAQGFSDSQ